MNLALKIIIPVAAGLALIRLWIGGPYRVKSVKKPDVAEEILTACLGNYGIHADPTRYRYQLWTRDLDLALLPAARYIQGGLPKARTHLIELASRQRPNGQIPIIFLDGPKGHMAFLWDKIYRSATGGRISFMLRRYLVGELWNLTPGTKDSELHFVRAVQTYSRMTGDGLDSVLTNRVNRALNYIESTLAKEKGSLLMLGADWRDTMEAELADKALLTNNAMLYGVFMKAGRRGGAELIKMGLESRPGGLLEDYPGADRPDPLGIALGVLEGLIPEDMYPKALTMLRSVDTDNGVTIKCKHNPLNQEEREVINRTDGVVIWPFVIGYTILAASKMGPAGQEFAVEQVRKLENLHGFREWYDPKTGKGYGAELQGWSAALYLRVLREITI